MIEKKRILVAPLNWGLGHATRCIPVINRLSAFGFEVLLASDGEALELLKAEFPGKATVVLPSYNISYKTQNMLRNIAPQVPRLFATVRKERKVLQNMIKKHQIDAVLSDNRYGLYTRDIPCIFMTHQLNILTPYACLERLTKILNHYFIKKFSACWVPDFEQELSLAGRLSHSTKLDNLVYIGLLSRMKSLKRPKKYDLMAILSGPEPQRSFFEKKIIQQATQLPIKVLLVRGKPQEKRQVVRHLNMEIHNYMTSSMLNEKIAESGLVLARSGYSTLMDLTKIGGIRSILVPTAGQTEQIYLARRFAEKGYLICQNQTNFNLKRALEQTQQLKGFPKMRNSAELLDQAIEQLSTLLKN